MSLQRRSLLKTLGGAGLLGLASPREQRAQEQVARATRAMPTPKIKDISVIECQPEGVRLTVVKITTDQDGLYGYGCATFTQRADVSAGSGRGHRIRTRRHCHPQRSVCRRNPPSGYHDGAARLSLRA